MTLVTPNDDVLSRLPKWSQILLALADEVGTQQAKIDADKP